MKIIKLPEDQWGLLVYVLIEKFDSLCAEARTHTEYEAIETAKDFYQQAGVVLEIVHRVQDAEDRKSLADYIREEQ